MSALQTIPCKVTLGMFSTERGVIVDLPSGQRVSALVDRRSVLVDHDPVPGGVVSGRVKVFVVGTTADNLIVELPQAGFASGPRVVVPKTLVGTLTAR